MGSDFAAIAKDTQALFAIKSNAGYCDSRNTAGMDIEDIRRGLETPGKSKSGLAKALGLDPAAVTRLLQGKRLLKAAEIQTVRDYLGPDTAPLPPPEQIIPAPALSRHDMPQDVPVYGTAVGGSVGDFQLNGQTVDYVRRPPALRNALNAFAIYYANDSMYPAYEAGDPIYINPAIHPRPGDNVLIELHPARDGTPGAAYVKRLVRKAPTYILVGQYNPPRDDIRFETAKIKAIWRIVPVRELLGV
jgi:phage repressor protein C with HTH and peptisase S24 domain